ncbi:MAG: arcadin 1 [Thermoproteales archaeon]|nr:arcadin 1 [Thermoproteales archaeon]
MGELKFKAVISSKTLISNPLGEHLVKLELVEERELPGPIIASQSRDGDLMREIMPIVNQVVRSLTPKARITIPRLTLFLTEEEWDMISRKPEIGEEVEVVIHEEKGELSIKIVSL